MCIRDSSFSPPPVHNKTNANNDLITTTLSSSSERTILISTYSPTNSKTTAAPGTESPLLLSPIRGRKESGSGGGSGGSGGGKGGKRERGAFEQ
eukprot:146360-Amorphochlora_amoeboformis.AAC.1